MLPGKEALTKEDLVTVYVEAFVNCKSPVAGIFQIIELLDEEGDDLTRYLDQPSKLFTIGELTEVLERKFNTDVCIELIEDGSPDIPFRTHDSPYPAFTG
jgi:hypothetical protein